MFERNLTSFLSQVSVFRDLDEEVLSRLVDCGRVTTLQPGEFAVREGEAADDLLVLLGGEVDVLKEAEEAGTLHRINVLKEGQALGELGIVERVKRSASVRATQETRLFRLSIDDIHRCLQESPSSKGTLYENLSRLLGQRLRDISVVSVGSLERELKGATARIGLGNFLITLIILLSVYAYGLEAILSLNEEHKLSTLITVPMALLCLVGTIVTVRLNGFAASFYGVTTRGWGRSLSEGILFSIPLLAACVLFKWLWLGSQPDGVDVALFQFGERFEGEGWKDIWITIAMLSLYPLIVVPIQEFIVRGCMQRSMEHFLVGKWRIFWSVLASNLIFSVFHLFMSLEFALITFGIGCFWGWMFSRHQSLIGTVVSHALIGIFALDVVGLYAIMEGTR